MARQDTFLASLEVGGVDGTTILVGSDFLQWGQVTNRWHKEQCAPTGSRMLVRSELMAQPKALGTI